MPAYTILSTILTFFVSKTDMMLRFQMSFLPLVFHKNRSVANKIRIFVQESNLVYNRPPAGSQEVVHHTYKWSQLIGYLCVIGVEIYWQKPNPTIRPPTGVKALVSLYYAKICPASYPWADGGEILPIRPLSRIYLLGTISKSREIRMWWLCQVYHKCTKASQ